MSLRKKFLHALALVLIGCSAATAQQTAPAPSSPPVAPAPATPPAAPEAPSDFTFLVGGGSFLGIYPEDITRENMSRYNLREARGVAISKVIEGSPAEKAGLKKDDVVLRFNGEEVSSVRKLNRLIAEVAPDHTARLSISRNGSEQELSVTLEKRKGMNAQLFNREGEGGKLLEGLSRAPGAFTFALGSSRRIGVSTNTLTKQLADYFGVNDGAGVLVTDVKDGSPADKAGLKAGDVITQVDNERIENVGDLMRSINRKSEGDITLTIIRDKSQRSINVTPEKGQATPFPGSDFRFETAPRIGQLALPVAPIAPQIRTIAAPRIQALPRVRALTATRPL